MNPRAIALRSHKIVAPIEIVNDNGMYRIHKAGCREITARNRKVEHNVWSDATVGQTLSDYAEMTFSDVASDQHEPGTPEHADACWSEFGPSAVVSPCAMSALSLEPPAPRVPSAPLRAPGLPPVTPYGSADDVASKRLQRRLNAITVGEYSLLCRMAREGTLDAFVADHC